MSELLRLRPLGGLGQFGMNCMLIETNKTRIIVDCGVMFPEESHPGVDLLIPDFDLLYADTDAPIDALYLTHGHEDHIGAVPFLLQALRARDPNSKLPIIGTDFTLALVRRKLDERGVLDAAELIRVKAGKSHVTGDFDVEFVHVNHSIPQACLLAMKTPVGRVVHTGDWRLDPSPVGEPVADLARLAELGVEGVRLLLADSTNSNRQGITRTELEVARELEDLLDFTPHRLVLTMFSSHVRRLQAVLQAAEATDRKVVLAGRSLEQNFATARELGLLRVPEGVLLPVDEWARIPRDQAVAVVAGTQGEPQSNLTRLAFGEHSLLFVEPDDTVAYSARVIPGNEKSISRVVDEFKKAGVNVIAADQRPIHASGHGYREEMKLMMNLLRPTLLVPVHGDFTQLTDHAALADDVGIQNCVIQNGDTLMLDPTSHKLGTHHETDYAFVIGSGVGAADNETLRQRRQIAYVGVIFLHLILDAEHDLVQGPFLQSIGVTCDATHFTHARDLAERTLENLDTDCPIDEIAEELRRAVRRYFRKAIDRKPVVIPSVVRLPPGR